MSKRILVAALAVSLLFNLAVLIGFMQARAGETPIANSQPDIPAATAPADGALLQRVAGELGLDAKQSGALQDLHRRQRQQASVFGDSLMVVRQDLTEELRKQQPDLDRVRTLVDQEADLLRQRRLAETDLYGEFVGLLSPQQRQALGERIAPLPRQRGAGPGNPPPPDVVRRFDRNNNGRLEPEEAEQARQDLEQRRREFAPRQPPRPAIWPWFDLDGDGELSDAERAELEQFTRAHRPPNPPAQQQQPQPPPRQGPRNGERRGFGPERGPDARPDGPPAEQGPGQPPMPPPPNDDPIGEAHRV